MRLFAALAGACWACVTVAFGQSVSVEVSFEQQAFLPHESILAKVRITNFSGQTLVLGKDTDWLKFVIEGNRGFVVPQLSPLPEQEEFKLDSAKAATKYVNVTPHYELSRPGHYTLVALVKIPQFQRSVESDRVGFDLISGSKVWEQDFGLPAKEGDQGPPEIRKYALLQTIHQDRLRVYLRVSNASETRVFRVFSVGPMVSVSRLEPQIDKFSNLHLLYQTGSRRFLYSTVNPDGLLIARETYDISNTRPILRVDQQGRIRVSGGTRRVDPTDIPPPYTPNEVSDAKQP